MTKEFQENVTIERKTIMMTMLHFKKFGQVKDKDISLNNLWINMKSVLDATENIYERKCG